MISSRSDLYPRLREGCLLRREGDSFYLYDSRSDSVFQLDREAFDLLRMLDGERSLETILERFGAQSKDVIEYLVEEGCLEILDSPMRSTISVGEMEEPALRYAQVAITYRCNLRCRHCYLGDAKPIDMDVSLFDKLISEFRDYGWKVILTGGEPLAHPKIWDILALARRSGLRIEILTNGTLIDEEIANRLSEMVHMVRISLDGMERGHEALRGRGTFERTLRGIEHLVGKVELGISTIVHRDNLDELGDLEKLVREIGAREWLLDYPVSLGRASRNSSLIPSIEEAIDVLRRYGFGYGIHGSSGDYACGSHLCSLDPLGNVRRCDYFDHIFGNIRRETLYSIWRRIVERGLQRLDQLRDCKECDMLDRCRGGCRFRALTLCGDILGRDPLACRLFGARFSSCS